MRWLVVAAVVGIGSAVGLLAVQGRLTLADLAEAASVNLEVPNETPPTTAQTPTSPPATTRQEPEDDPEPLALAPEASDRSAGLPGVLLIGDSILEGLRLLDRDFGPGTVYDTKVSRSIFDLPERIEEQRAAGQLPHRIVIHLGTNGWQPGADAVLDQVITGLDGHRVVLVDVAVDRPWAAAANQAIHERAARHEHVHLASWQEAVRPDLLRTDLVHPNDAGFDVLGRLIGRAAGIPPHRSEPPFVR